jgi:hypothetical protein
VEEETALGVRHHDCVITADEARRLALRAQGLLGTQGRHGGVSGALRRLSAVQLDTISVLARSHELVPYARLGPVGRDKVERAYWNPARPAAFEYWAHAACILPLEDWPYYAARRRRIAARRQRWHKVSDRTCDEVLARLRGEGPLTATELGGAKAGGPWWDWSEVKIAAEWLLDTGQAACVRRTGWRRVYDLPERVIPPESLAKDLSDTECLSYLVSAAVRALGVATHADIREHLRLPKADTIADIDRVAAEAGLTPVTIEGGAPPPRGGAARSGTARSGASKPLRAWADPDALSWLSAGGRGTHRTTLLSPFDSLVWDRKRTARVFGFQHVLEAYVPKDKRVHGYFTMPLLAGGRLVGRADPARDGKTLVLRQASVASAAAARQLAQAATEAAAWVNCDTVTAERFTPAEYAPAFADALKAQG